MHYEATGTFVAQGYFDNRINDEGINVGGNIWREYDTQEILPHVIPDEALEGVSDDVRAMAQRGWIMARDLALANAMPGNVKTKRYRLSVDADETHITPHCEEIPFADGTKPGEWMQQAAP